MLTLCPFEFAQKEATGKVEEGSRRRKVYRVCAGQIQHNIAVALAGKSIA